MFSSNLKSLRKSHKLSQDELAQKIGISKSAISMYETDNRLPSLDVLINICEIFNTDMNFLLGYKGQIMLSSKEVLLVERYRTYIDHQNTIDKILDLDGEL